MKNIKNNKLKIISAAILAIGFSTQANAQWATINVQDYINRMFQSAGSNGIKGAVDMVKSSVDNQARQSVLNQEDTDARSRKAQAEQAARNKLDGMLPTVEQCIELTAQDVKAPSIAASTRSANGGSQGAGPGGSRTMVKTTADNQANVLKEKQSLGTCTPDYAGSAGCTEASGRYAGGDVHPRGIKGNIEGVSIASNDGASYKNYTYTDTGFKVAQKYAADMAYFDKPKVATREQLAKNPAYAAMYASIMSKLDAANDTIIDSVKLKRETRDVPSGIAGQVWTTVTDAKFAKVTGLEKKPTKPSIYDIINYAVSSDYVGDENVDLSSVQETNKRLALSNYIAWKSYQQQENTNLLLAHLLVQATTPVSKTQVDNEHAKTMTIK